MLLGLLDKNSHTDAEKNLLLSAFHVVQILTHPAGGYDYAHFKETNTEAQKEEKAFTRTHHSEVEVLGLGGVI